MAVVADDWTPRLASAVAVVALINKVERLPDRTLARETAERLLREPAIESVMLTALRGEEPVLEIRTR